MKYSHLIKLSIVSVESGNKLGEVAGLIINYDTGKCLALLLKPDSVFGKKKIVLFDDINNLGDDAVMVQNKGSIIPLKSSDELATVVKKDIKIISNKVITYSGDLLGEIKDYEFDEVSFKLTKLFVSTGFLKDLIKGELIITANKIVSIGRDAIIVKDAVVGAGGKSSGKVNQEERLVKAGVLNKEL